MTPLCKFCGGTDIIIVKLSSVFLIYRDMCYHFFFPLKIRELHIFLYGILWNHCIDIYNYYTIIQLQRFTFDLTYTSSNLLYSIYCEMFSTI
jgi:hypothetical protein